MCGANAAYCSAHARSTAAGLTPNISSAIAPNGPPRDFWATRTSSRCEGVNAPCFTSKSPRCRVRTIHAPSIAGSGPGGTPVALAHAWITAHPPAWCASALRGWRCARTSEPPRCQGERTPDAHAAQPGQDNQRVTDPPEYLSGIRLDARPLKWHGAPSAAPRVRSLHRLNSHGERLG